MGRQRPIGYPGRQRQAHVYQVSYILPLVTKLQESGVPMDRLIKKSDLRYFDLTDTELYIPAPVLEKFLTMLQNDVVEGRIAETFHDLFIPEIPSDFGSHICNAPSLLSVSRRAIKSMTLYQSNMNLNLNVIGNKAVLLHHTTGWPSKGTTISDQIGLARSLNALRKTGGPDWVPLEVQIKGDIREVEDMLPSGQYPVYDHQPETKVFFRTSMLHNKMQLAFPMKEVHELPPPLVGYTSRIEKILESCVPGHVHSLTDLSDYFNMSKRTLRRHLTQEGTSFAEILDRFLFSRACRLLENSAMKIEEISEYLHYANPSNFLRAFKKWTGTTPGDFREGLHG